MARITLKQARQEVKAIGATIRSLPEYGEYRLTLPGYTEAQAYYTNDLADVVDTAQAMARGIRA